jgi:hypothetical protein
MIRKVDGLEELAPLHFGPGGSSIFLWEAYTSQFVAAGACARAALAHPSQPHETGSLMEYPQYGCESRASLPSKSLCPIREFHIVLAETGASDFSRLCAHSL